MITIICKKSFQFSAIILKIVLSNKLCDFMFNMFYSLQNGSSNNISSLNNNQSQGHNIFPFQILNTIICRQLLQ